MNKIILAALTAFAMFAMSDVALARRSQNTQVQYSANYEDVNYDPLSGILGNDGDSWAVSPRIRNRKVLRHAYVEHEDSDNLFAYHTHSSIVAYGHMLQGMGLRVSEHPSFGGIKGHHHGWAHTAGRAIDVNVGRGVYEAHSHYAHRFDQIAANARAAGYTVLWRVPGHYNHMHIQRQYKGAASCPLSSLSMIVSLLQIFFSYFQVGSNNLFVAYFFVL